MFRIIVLIALCIYCGLPGLAVPLRAQGSLDATDEAVILGISDCGIAQVQLTGTWSGTVTFEGTVLGNSWVAIPSVNSATGATSTTTTSNGIYTFACSGYNKIRVRFSTASSGTVVATIQCGNGSSLVYQPIAGTVALSSSGTGLLGKVSIDQTTPGTTNLVHQVQGAAVTHGSGKRAVTTTMTSVLLPSQAAREIVVKALMSNTGTIYVKPGGSAGQDYTVSSSGGASFELGAGDSYVSPLISNINEIAIDSSVSGEGVSFIWNGY